MSSTTTIELGPLIQFVAPIAASVASGMISLGVAYGLVLLKRMTGVSVDAAEVAQVRAFANDQAGKAIAASASNLAHESITVASPQVIAGVQLAQSVIPALLKSTGITPEHVAGMITAEIGRLQPTPPPTATASVLVDNSTTEVPAPVARRLQTT